MTDAPEERKPPDEPHGLVEEIRHEIHEVVEHVPKPVRWTVRKLVLLGGAILFGLVVLGIVSAALYYANRTELVAHELTLFLNTTLASRSNLRIEVGDVRGNPFRQVRLVRPRVVFADGGETLLEAPWIQLGYTPWNLLRGKPRAIDVIVESPTVRLSRGPDGKLRLPTWTAGPRRPSAGFDVRLRLRGGRILGLEPEAPVEGLTLDARITSGSGTRVHVGQLAWKSGPYASRDLRLTGELQAADSVRFAVTRLESRDFVLRARGGWSDPARRHVHIDVDRIEWRWIARVANNRAFDVPGEGTASIDAVGDARWSGRFSSRLTWNDLGLAGRGGFTFDGRRLIARPLVAESAAGTLNGMAGWSKAGWEVGGRVTAGDPSRWGAIGIPGWPEGSLAGDFRYVVDTRRGISNGRLTADVGPSTIAGWAVDGGRVEVDLPAVGERPFTVHALRRGGTFDLQGAAVAGGWNGRYQVAGLPLEEWPDGRATGIRGILRQGAGSVEGRDGRLRVTGDLDGVGTDWLGTHAASWRLRGVDGTLLPAPDLRAEARLADVMFLGVHFDSAAAPIHLGDRTLDLDAVTATAGDTVVTAGGRSDWNGTSWQIVLDRAAAVSSQFHWTAEPPLHLVGDRAGVVFERFRARDSVATLEFTGRWAAAAGGIYDASLHASRLDLSRLGLPREWGLAGTADARIDVGGPYGDPRWTGEARVSQPAWGGHRGDSLTVSLAGAPSRLDVRNLAFRLDDGWLESSGGFADMPRAWPDSLNGGSIARWLETARAWTGTIAAREFPIDRVTGWSPVTAGWAGALSGTVRVAGSPALPEFQADATIRPLTWKAFSLEELRLKANYRDERLEVPEVRASQGEFASTGRAVLPMRLALGRPPELLDRPMTGSMDVRRGDLSLLPRLVAPIGAAAGQIEFAARFGGTPVHPKVDGRGNIRGASLRLSGRNEVVRDVNGSFHLDGSTLTLDTLTARQGDRGTVRASGTVALENLAPRSYRFDLAMQDFTASEPGVYAVEFDGDFVVTNGPRVRGQVLPYVTGRATVHNAVILIDFANQTEDEQLAASNQPLYWLYRIDLDAKSGVRWQPPDGDIEFSADLTAEQTVRELRLFGEMRSLRGTYYFLSNRFDVKQADLTFDNVYGVNPVIDAEAVTRVVPLGHAASRVGAGSAARDEPHDVTVTISGRAREPRIAFASSPSDWDENEILRELTVGRFVSGQGLAQGDPFDSYLTRALNRTLSEEMSQIFKGYVNEWMLEREQGGLFVGEGEVIAGVGVPVTPNLTLRYRQRLPGLGREIRSSGTNLTLFERDLEAEYRLNRFFLVTSEIAQRRTLSGAPSTSSSGPDFNVNLKARWEY